MELPIFIALLGMFVLGAIVGSFLNVCIYRIPLEKSILWPGSHCGQCLQPVRWYDNVPLLSYWLLRGRCRTCGVEFSLRYFLVELLTALSFAGLFYLEVIDNVGELPMFAAVHRQVVGTGGRMIDLTLVPGPGWGLLAFHLALVCFLIVTSFCDADHLEIPLPVTVTGTVVGLVCGTILWHWLPTDATLQTPLSPFGRANLQVTPGVYPWPVWTPLPAWLPTESVWTGLATGCAGVLAGTMVLRAVRFVFGVGRGIEGLGVGDADLMMMAGSFIGWQPIIVAFFVAVFPALVFGILQLVFRGHQMLPFGPSLALGIVITLLGWQSIGPRFADIFFNGAVLLFLAGAGVVVLLIASFLLRLLRR